MIVTGFFSADVKLSSVNMMHHRHDCCCVVVGLMRTSTTRAFGDSVWSVRNDVKPLPPQAWR